MNDIKETKRRPLILVSNDDGIDAKGVHELIDHLLEIGDIVCVCPDSPRSGQSMALTVNNPLRIYSLDDYRGVKMYKVNGTPVDCVKIGIDTILKCKPDLVVAGINHGSNASVNVLYSGTMGAAFEGCTYGVPSIGFSLTSHDPKADFSICYPFVKKIVTGVLERGLPYGVCLNVNIPAGVKPVQMRAVEGCKGRWTDEYEEYTDPAGQKFYWLTGKFINTEPDNVNTDEWCLSHGIVSVVPTYLDRTSATGKDFSWLNHTFDE